MKYTVSGLSSIKINETSGTIQNISGEKIEVSDSANFTDSFILYPLNQCTFEKQLYIRAYGGFSQSAEVNVVSFFLNGNVGKVNAKKMVGEISDGGAVVIKDTVVYLGETRLIISGLNNPKRNDDGTVSDIEIDDVNSEAKLFSSVLNLDSTNVELKKATGNYEGYTLAVGDDAPEHTPTSAIWEVESGTVTYTAEYPTEGGYIAIKSGTKIIYDSETSTTFEIAGLRNDLTVNTETQKIDGFILDYKDVTIPAEAIDSETQVTVSGSGYEFHFTAASNVLAGKGTRVIGSSGNDIIRTNSAGTFINTGGGRDTIYAFANEEGVITVRGGGGNSLIFFADVGYTPQEPESDAGENEPDSNEDDNG